MTKKVLNKIVIVGDSCRGKSTLASKISKKLGIQNYSTDDYYYEVKFTQLRDRQESIDSILEVYKNEKWIVEGTTKHLIEHGFESADQIIHLRHKSIFIQWGILIKRYFERDNENIIGLLGLIRHVFYIKYKLGYRKKKPSYSDLVAPYKHKTITLSSFKEIDDFLDSL